MALKKRLTHILDRNWYRYLLYLSSQQIVDDFWGTLACGVWISALVNYTFSHLSLYATLLWSFKTIYDTHHICADVRTIMNYHNKKMLEINKIIRELWRNTYRGNGLFAALMHLSVCQMVVHFAIESLSTCIVMLIICQNLVWVSCDIYAV